jgi:hypothetical protein
MGYLRSFLESLELGYFRLRIFEYSNFDTGLRLNFLNLTAYSLLLLGAFLYWKTAGRETRLVRYLFSIILLSSILSLISVISVPLTYPAHLFQDKTLTYTFLVLNSLKCVGLAYISFVIVKGINRSKNLKTVYGEAHTGVVPNLVSSTLNTRFMHQVLDTITCLLMFTPHAPLLSFLGGLENLMGEQFTIFVLFVIVRLLYYPFYELLFNATPAKFFTETRVVSDLEAKPETIQIVARTLSRFIPFEPFSFFGKRGWHDSLPQTKVVDEVSTGVDGTRYFWIFPGILVAVLLGFIGNEWYDNHKSYVYRRNKHNNMIASFKDEFRKLSASTLIQIEDISETYSEYDYFLKVEEIKGDDITAYVIMRKQNYSKSLIEIEMLYNQYKETGSLQVVTFKRSDLDTAYTYDYNQWKDRETRNTAALMNDDKKFHITYVDRLFAPGLQGRGTGSYGTDISMEMMNYGWPGNIVSIETIEGTIDWTNQELPKRMPPVRIGDNDYPSFYLQGANYERNSGYKFRVDVEDTLGGKHSFLVEGHNLQQNVTRLN